MYIVYLPTARSEQYPSNHPRPISNKSNSHIKEKMSPFFYFSTEAELIGLTMRSKNFLKIAQVRL